MKKKLLQTCLSSRKIKNSFFLNPLLQSSFSFKFSKLSKSPKNSLTPKSQNISKTSQNINISVQSNKSTHLNTKKQSQSKSILTEQQKNELAFQQKLNATYLQLQSLPSDSYQTVVENFKKIKNRTMDRKIYIPNKYELLQKLDKNLQFVKQHHKVWTAPSTAPDRRISDGKKQIIQWELNEAKQNYYISLLQNQKVLTLAASSVVLLMVAMQYYVFIKQQHKNVLPKPFL